MRHDAWPPRGAAVAGGAPDDDLDAEERHARLALSLVHGVGSVRFRELLRRHRSARAALATVAAEGRRAVEGEAGRVLARLEELGGTALHLETGAYPSSLLELGDPPPVLFAVGRLELLTLPAVAIVGTRAASPYGLRTARHLAAAVARAGGVVVSGMARGIDGAAHEAALDAAGGTVAVLGTGPDVAYPRAHVALHRAIARQGLLLSELPPGERADAGSFPRRNRIIAGLARVTVVVEAGHRSGALVTAAHALELGRAVAAVPGPIDQARSAGSNLLLRDGAHVLADPADLLQLAGLIGSARRPEPRLDGAQALVWQALAPGAADVDALVARTRLPTRECLAALAALEVAGLVSCALTGEVSRR